MSAFVWNTGSATAITLSSSGSSSGDVYVGICETDASEWYCQFSPCVKENTVLLSKDPADGLDPAEYIPTSVI